MFNFDGSTIFIKADQNNPYLLDDEFLITTGTVSGEEYVNATIRDSSGVRIRINMPENCWARIDTTDGQSILEATEFTQENTK